MTCNLISNNTIRVLSLDGGGTRGYMSLKFFIKFVQQWGISQEEIWKHFDVISGTSIGGILALGLALGITPDEMSPFFTVQAPYVFSLSSLVPSLRPNIAAKLALIAADIPFYQSSGITEEQYGSGLLYKTIRDITGTNTMQDLKTNVLIPSYEQDTSTYRLFSNLNYPEYTGQNELVSNVAIATSAAPIYLPALSLNNHVYKDGGIYQNNPARLALTLGKAIKPTAKRACVLSIGTGIGELGFDDGDPLMIDERVASQQRFLQDGNVGVIDSVTELFTLFEIAIKGGQESIDIDLFMNSEYSLDELYYYRFQPQLDLNLNTELDNTDPDILTYYENTADEWFNNDIGNINNFIGHLTA